MRLCVIGKYPPIQGGVSAHTYWLAHELAKLGHQVHVVTNANEVEQRFRAWMRPEDWRLCESAYLGGGYVRLHWTDADLNRQRHIPWSNPFLTKLVSTAVQVIREECLDLIFSYYLEPYGVAGHLAAEMTGRLHVIKLAGSDFGRLRTLPQFRPLYDHVLRKAARVIVGGIGAEELAACRITDVDDYRVPERVFHPHGPKLEVTALAVEMAANREWPPLRIAAGLSTAPQVGIYGKISEPKGTFDLLRALAAVRAQGQRFHLLAMAHGWGALEMRFQEMVNALGLGDCVTQLPFLPHWRVPEFIRACRAVCFLEREFPITGHMPTVPREVFACGVCLVASASILKNQSLAGRLVHGYNCLAVEDVRDVNELSSALDLALSNPDAAERIARRGYEYSCRSELGHEFPRNFEDLFKEVLDRRMRSAASRIDFPWCRFAARALGWEVEGSGDLFALSVYRGLLEMEKQRQLRDGLLLDAVRFELHASGLLLEESGGTNGLFRLACGDLGRECSTLFPVAAPGLTLRRFDYDVSVLAEAYKQGSDPSGLPRKASCAAFLPGGRAFSLTPLAVILLNCCDGTRTIGEVADQFGEAERAIIRETLIEWFEIGLLGLKDSSTLDKDGLPCDKKLGTPGGGQEKH